MSRNLHQFIGKGLLLGSKWEGEKTLLLRHIQN